MFAREQYEMIDFGDGRKLERFGPFLFNRPSPAAESIRPGRPVETWSADASYVRHRGTEGEWVMANKQMPSDWTISHAQLTFSLRPTDFGHVGIFPEQAANWDWIGRQVARLTTTRPPNVLNLFGYTGGSTLAAAVAGAQVVHVDASKSSVQWARCNAALSGSAHLPIRWIVEDATTFVRRELKRGNQYDAVILDPPSYGHGPKGETWKLNEDLIPLLQACAQLTRQTRQFILLTCHSPGFGPAEAEASLAEAVFGTCSAGAHAHPLWLRTESGRKLHAGIVARWP